MATQISGIHICVDKPGSPVLKSSSQSALMRLKDAAESWLRKGKNERADIEAKKYSEILPTPMIGPQALAHARQS